MLTPVEGVPIGQQTTSRDHDSMPGPVFIDGDRIDLRTIEEEDIDFLRECANDPDVRRYIGIFSEPYNREQYEDEWFDRFSSEDVVQLLVCNGDERLGTVSLGPIDERRGWANLGATIHPEYQSEGYATEACRLLVDYGFRERRLHRISAAVAAPNEASLALVEKLGFTHEGTKREDSYLDGEHVDTEAFGMLRGEWEAERA